MIWWNGKSSDDVNVIIERYPEVVIPTRKQEKISIPGRSGDLIMSQDAFENYTQRYEIFVSAETPRLTTVSHTVAEWLMVKGYQRLEDSYWLDTFRLACYTGGSSIDNILNRFGRATIEFDCKPQRFLKSGDIYVSLTNGEKLVNPTPFTAKPLVYLFGSGSGTFTINDKSITLTNTTNAIIDCEMMQVFRNNESVNSTASGEFPELPEGESTISWTGGILGIQIKPRWWTL